MKPRVNNTVAAHRLFTAGNYAAYRRHTRRRASLQDGVIVVRFIKVLPEGMAICADCKRAYYQADGEGCQCHVCWAASLTPPSPPWEEADPEIQKRAAQAAKQAVREMREQAQARREAERTEEARQYFKQSPPWPGGAA